MEISNKYGRNDFYVDGFLVSRADLHGLANRTRNTKIKKLYKKWVSGRTPERSLVLVKFTDSGSYWDSVISDFPFVIFYCQKNDAYNEITELCVALNMQMNNPKVLAQIRKKYPRFTFHL